MFIPFVQHLLVNKVSCAGDVFWKYIPLSPYIYRLGANSSPEEYKLGGFTAIISAVERNKSGALVF